MMGGFGNVVVPLSVSVTNKSGTITAGGTAQTAAAAKNNRVYLFIQNPSTETESLWFSTDTTAVAASPSVELQPGQSATWLVAVPQTAISVIAATTGHKFTVKQA